MTSDQACTIESLPNAARLRLAESVTASGAAQLHATLSPLVASKDAVEFDASATERIDLCALQLLVAFTRARRAGGCATTFAAKSAAFEDAASCCGLAAEFHDLAPASAEKA